MRLKITCIIIILRMFVWYHKGHRYLSQISDSSLESKTAFLDSFIGFKAANRGLNIS